jgi:hypothetical protein
MNQAERIGWGALYSNIGLNVAGILAIFISNVFWQAYGLAVLYLVSALFLGVPLFLITLFVVPVGAFRGQGPLQSKRYRRLFLLNVGLVALLFVPATSAMFFF